MRNTRKRNLISFVVSFVMIFNLFQGIGAISSASAKPKLNKTQLKLTTGRKATLKVKKISKKKIKKVTFKSSQKSIAKVSKKGIVTAKKPGDTTIKVKVLLKNKKKYLLKCMVKVLDGSAQENNTKITPRPTTTTEPSENTDDTKETPAPSKNPAETTKPSETTKPTETAKPSVTKEPEETEAPEATEDPNITIVPKEDLLPGEHYSKNGFSTSDNGTMRKNVDSFDIIRDMGLGINLGNTLESCGSWIDSSKIDNFEKAWGSPIITQKMITGYKNAGYKSVRIPVAWSNMMQNDDPKTGTYEINEAYFDRVETILNYVLREDMYAIINIHYDSAWWARFGSKDATERAQAMVKYKAMWSQIANRFVGYSDKLIFESANEELGHRLNDPADYSNSGYYQTDDEVYELLNTINQTFVDLVRNTGGNNKKRFLLIAGYDTDIAKTCDIRYHMPQDTIEKHLFVSIHYYDPAPYCLVDNPANDWGYSNTWGTENEIKTLKATLKKMKMNFSDKGYPVIIGEYGAADEKDQETGIETRKEGRALFFREVCEYALNNGMCPVLWDITNHVYDRKNAKMLYKDEADMYLELSEKLKELPVYEPQTDDGTRLWSGSIGYSGYYLPATPVADEESSISMTSIGACYKLSDINWSMYENPVLVLHNISLTGVSNATLQLANSEGITTENPGWTYVDTSKSIKEVAWTFSSDLTVDLNSLNLKNTDSLYLCLKGSDYSGKVSLTIKNKNS